MVEGRAVISAVSAFLRLALFITSLRLFPASILAQVTVIECVSVDASRSTSAWLCEEDESEMQAD